MPKLKNRNCDLQQYCNNMSNQYLILVTIFATIISQEIENDEDLGILGSFLVALGEELALASEMRIACKTKFENKSSSEEIIEDVFDRCSTNKPKKSKYIKKRYIKRVKKTKLK